MLAACIDIGTNTTRMLVAQVEDGRLSPVLERRAFTRLGDSLGPDGTIPPAIAHGVGEVVRDQAQVAARTGVKRLEVIATAAIRSAVNRTQVLQAISTVCGFEVRVIDACDEANLAFLGATATLEHPPDGAVAVVDVGGGSTEIAVGTVAAGVTWWVSLPIGSNVLTRTFLHSEPPSSSQLGAMLSDIEAAIDPVNVPPAETAIAVGGGAASLRRVVGSQLESGSLAAALSQLCADKPQVVADRLSIHPQRVRFLPASVGILSIASRHLKLPLIVGRGGVREGVILKCTSAAGA